MLCGLLGVCVTAQEKTRRDRGWVPCADDASIFEPNLDAMTDWQFVVANDGSLDELRAALERVFDAACSFSSSDTKRQ